MAALAFLFGLSSGRSWWVVFLLVASIGWSFFWSFLVGGLSFGGVYWMVFWSFLVDGLSCL
jgi:hypothetical protein